MDELLAMSWITLIGIVVDHLVLISHQEGFPDGRFAIIRQCDATMGDMADEIEGLRAIGGGVEFELGLGEVVWDAVSREEDCSSFELSYGFVEFVEKGLVAEAPAIDLVIDFCAFGPGLAAIDGLVDGEVGKGVVVWEVVFPGCEEEARFFELEGAGVEGARDGVV